MAKHSVTPIILAAAAGFLLDKAFPYATIPLLAWISLVPLLAALEGRRPAHALLIGWLAGAVFFGQVLSWGGIFGVHVHLALALFQGSWLALFGLLHALMQRAVTRERSALRIFMVPALWVTVEGLRAAGPMGLTWGALGYSQHPYPILTQISSVTGFYGVSFLVALVNAVLAALLMRCDRGVLKALGVTAALFAVTLLYGHARLSAPPAAGRSIAAGIVQVNTENAVKWDRRCLPLVQRRLAEMTGKAAGLGCRYVVWPETSIPDNLLANPVLKDWLCSLALRYRVYLLFGTPDWRAAEGKTYNSVVLVSPRGEVLQVYDKLRLVPFGEYLPFSRYLRPNHLFDRVQNFSRGRERVLFRTPEAQFAALVCFESMFPSHAAAEVRRGANLLVVLTNDAWFGESSAAEHHFIISCFRALENGVPMVQSANTGISGACDEKGRVLCRSILAERIVLDAKVYAGGHPRTLYTAVGDLFLYLCALFAVLVLLRPRLRRKAGGV